MLIAAIPLFDSQMSVGAYYFLTQKGTNLMISNQSTGVLDGATYSLALDVINTMGLEALSGGKPVFVSINHIALLVDIEKQCTVDPQKIVFVLDKSVEPTEMYLKRIYALKGQGYKIAIRKITNFDHYSDILSIIDYIFLDQRTTDLKRMKTYFHANYPKLKLIASNIETAAIFKNHKYDDFALYEGRFYRLPLTKGSNTVTALKVNYIQLLNIVNDENFEIGKVAEIVQQDTALAISLLKLVNSLGLASEIKSIKHAAAILGQQELRRWITTAIANELYSDKPSEITRLSLIRAKFAENLAPSFELAIQASELFLLGLFSVLDIILEMPIKDALNIVKVGGNVSAALVDNKGKFAPILEFIKTYETADWQEVSRLIIINNIQVDSIYKAYTDSLKWYSNLISSISKEDESVVG